MPISILLLTVLWTAGVDQESELPLGVSGRLRQARQAPLLTQIGALVDEASLMWERHGALPVVAGAVERVFEDNKWDTETDRFVLALFDEVRTVPAHDVLGRFELLVGGLSDRYLLDDEQADAMREQLVHGLTELVIDHGWSVMPALSDIVATRAGGEPIMAEQVASLMELVGPVLADARRQLTGSAQEFAEQLDPEQRELLLQDLAATDQRIAALDAVRRNWARGAWQATVWGMENDSVQQSRALASGETGERAAVSPAERQVEAEPGASPEFAQDDVWSRYIRVFIDRYKLNQEQQQVAWLMYRQAKVQEKLILRRSRATAEMTNRAGAQAARRNETIRDRETKALERLFDRIKARLEKIPTRRQRREAEARRATVPPD